MIVSGYSIINTELSPTEELPHSSFSREELAPFRPTNTRLCTTPHNKASPRRLDFSASRPPSNRPATTPPSQQGKRMVVKEAYTPLERYCYGSNCRNDATHIGWSLIHFSTNSYVESFPPSRGIKEVGGGMLY